MVSKRIIGDADFGRIVLRTRRTARNLTMRVRADGLYVTVPPYSLTSKVLEAIEPYRSRLVKEFRCMGACIIDLNFSIQAECFRLSLEVGTSRCFSVREAGGEMKVLCPRDVDFSQKETQRLVRAAIVRALKKAAASYLPPLLDVWAQRYGLSYRKVRITGARTRWGSCSAARTISLSCYLMLLPARLMDYVLLHELVHTKEMNHGLHFWELLDGMTEGEARLLRKELRNYRAGF